MRKIELQPKQFTIRTALPIELTERLDHQIGAMVYELEATFLSHRQPPFAYSTPANWWEHFKEAYFTEWLLSKFPVHYKKHEVTLDVIYPKLDLAVPKDRAGITVCLLINDRPQMVFDRKGYANEPKW